MSFSAGLAFVWLCLAGTGLGCPPERRLRRDKQLCCWTRSCLHVFLMLLCVFSLESSSIRLCLIVQLCDLECATIYDVCILIMCVQTFLCLCICAILIRHCSCVFVCWGGCRLAASQMFPWSSRSPCQVNIVWNKPHIHSLLNRNTHTSFTYKCDFYEPHTLSCFCLISNCSTDFNIYCLKTKSPLMYVILQ